MPCTVSTKADSVANDVGLDFRTETHIVPRSDVVAFILRIYLNLERSRCCAALRMAYPLTV